MSPFLISPWAKWLGLLLGIGLAVVLLVRWDSARIDRHRGDERERCNAAWRDTLAKAEKTARDAIRAQEEAAYQRGVEAEAKRQSADASDAAETEAIIREVLNESATARACVLDGRSADALNRLRDQ